MAYHLMASFANAAANILGNGAQADDPVKVEILKPPAGQQARASAAASAVHAAAPSAPPLPLEAGQPVASTVPEAAASATGAAAQSSLEEFEKRNMALLQERDGNKKTKAKTPVLKRPASSKGMAKDQAKTKPVKKPTKKCEGNEPALKKGCLRCRGSPSQCDTCSKPTFGGKRFTRKEWVAYARLHGLK